MKNINKYILGVLALFLFAVQSADAQNLAGTEISTTIGQDDPNALCAKAFGEYTGPRVFRNGVVSACPGKACTGNFGNGTFLYDYMRFKNIVNLPVCVTVDFNTGACAFNVHSWAQYSPFTPPGDLCLDNPGWLGDIGSSVTQPYSFEVDGCTPFSVVQGTNFNNTPCGYSFTIVPDPLLDLRCENDTAVCVEKVKIGGTPVPTMTQWGLFLFGLIVLTLGVVTIYNMSTRSATERS